MNSFLVFLYSKYNLKAAISKNKGEILRFMLNVSFDSVLLYKGLISRLNAPSDTFVLLSKIPSNGYIKELTAPKDTAHNAAFSIAHII